MSVSQTSLESWDAVQGYKVPSQCQQILALMRDGVARTNMEIKVLSGLPINVVTARVNMLWKAGSLKVSNIGYCAITGHNAKKWVKTP